MERDPILEAEAVAVNLTTGDVHPCALGGGVPIAFGPPPIVRVDFWSHVLQRWVCLSQQAEPQTGGALCLGLEQVAWLVGAVRAGQPLPVALQQMGI